MTLLGTMPRADSAVPVAPIILEIEIAERLLLASRTMKQASFASSSVHGGGKRRASDGANGGTHVEVRIAKPPANDMELFMQIAPMMQQSFQASGETLVKMLNQAAERSRVARLAGLRRRPIFNRTEGRAANLAVIFHRCRI
jgi:hypothetical protein